MYLFTRRVRLVGGKLRAHMAWATSITEKVTQTGGMQVSLWSQTFSPSVGTLVWSTFASELAELEAMNEKLMVDEGYLELVERGGEFVLPGAVDDSLSMIIHGEALDPDRRAEYVAVVRTTMVAGGMARGITVGIEIAEKAEQITGLKTSFLADATGNYGGVRWLTAFANVGELERAQLELNGNQSFIELIDSQASSVYTDTPGATSQLIFRRII